MINVSAIPEVENLDERVVQKLHLNMLMPGTILQAEPIQSAPHGVYVELGNGLFIYMFLSQSYGGFTTVCVFFRNSREDLEEC